MVAVRLRRNFNYLKYLRKAKKQERCSLLKTAHRDLIVCICDCAANVLQGRVRISSKHKKALQRHKATLRTLAEKRKGIKTKRQLLIQRGGFLPALLAPILTVAGGLLSNFLRPLAD